MKDRGSRPTEQQGTMPGMDRPLYRPTPRQAIALAAIAALALSYGFVMRYAVIQNSVIGIGCEASTTWLCSLRRATIVLFQPQVFGLAGLAAALCNLLRPSFIAAAIALLAGGAGIVLYNTSLSAFAVA